MVDSDTWSSQAMMKESTLSSNLAPFGRLDVASDGRQAFQQAASINPSFGMMETIESQ
jgi:hypothetical protein